jgi:hypothetical protein
VTTSEDPLAEVTLSPRGFVALAAVAALVIGLVLALVPVRVAGPDIVRATSVPCGSALGGVETPGIALGLQNSNRAELVEYVAMCERALSERETFASVLFFGGVLTGLWLGVVRRRRPDPAG